jgi:hypothetical protein
LESFGDLEIYYGAKLARWIMILGIDEVTAIQLGHMDSVLSINVPKENLASDSVRPPCISGR